MPEAPAAPILYAGLEASRATTKVPFVAPVIVAPEPVPVTVTVAPEVAPAPVCSLSISHENVSEAVTAEETLHLRATVLTVPFGIINPALSRVNVTATPVAEVSGLTTFEPVFKAVAPSHS